MRRDRDDEEYEPEMPPTGECAHILRYLWEIGPALAGGTGMAPVSQQEIESWQRNASVVLQPWEARWIRDLSVAYLSELFKSEDPKRPAPWVSDGFVQEKLAGAAQSMRRAMSELANL